MFNFSIIIIFYMKNFYVFCTFFAIAYLSLILLFHYLREYIINILASMIIDLSVKLVYNINAHK